MSHVSMISSCYSSCKCPKINIIKMSVYSVLTTKTVSRSVIFSPCPLQALPRRRVSVAVVPKFNLLNIPGQTPATAGPGPSPASSPNTGPTTGTALPVLVGLPVLSRNDGKGRIKYLIASNSLPFSQHDC